MTFPLTNTRWERICLWLAATKVAVGAAGLLAQWPLGSSGIRTPFPPEIFLAHLLMFGGSAGLLIWISRGERSAFYLGAVFLVVASSFSNVSPYEFSGLLSAGSVVLNYLHPETFLPYFLWQFVSSFPKTPSIREPSRRIRFVIATCFLVGVTLFSANVAIMIVPFVTDSPGFIRILALVDRSSSITYYWSTLFALSLLSFPVLIWKGYAAHSSERRRVTLFLYAIAIGFGPMFLLIFLEGIIPVLYAFMVVPSHRLAAGYILYPLLLSVPVTATYLVLVHHVLPARLIFRQSLQYGVVKYAMLVAAALPFVLVIAYLYDPPNEGLVTIFLFVGTLAGLVAFRVRKGLLERLDRRFFREEYDSRQILARLSDDTREAAGLEELVELLKREIDRALHLDSLAILISDHSQGRLTAPDRAARPLNASSELAQRLALGSQPLNVDLEDLASSVGTLPLEDQQWVADGPFRLLVPLIGSDGVLLGLIALGEKRSELPFSPEDRLLLKSIAASSALTIENRQLRTTDMAVEEQPAMECQGCGRMHPPGEQACTACGEPVFSASVPQVLQGRFRLESRLGRGGMGIVYKAYDLNLAR